MKSKPPSPDTEIPELPGHYWRTLWYFVRCFLGMVAGIGFFGLGLHWQVIPFQVVGGVAAFASFLFMFGTMSRVRSAKCPSCSSMMAQGWDAKQSCSDGVFTCPQCHSRWRTRAVWGLE